MSKVKVAQNLKVMIAGLEGKSAQAVADEIGVSKERICQLYRRYEIDTRAIRRELKQKKYEILIPSIQKQLEKDKSVRYIREKFSLKNNDINSLLEKGIDLRLVNKELNDERYKTCHNLYKKGLTAYEIIDLLPSIKTPNRVYYSVNKISGTLPKRISTRKKKSSVLTNKIVKLKTNHTFEEITEILNERGVTNLNGGKMKVGTVIRRFYNNEKSN